MRGATSAKPVPPLTEEEISRFWRYVRKDENGCWIWTYKWYRGSRDTQGSYGKIRLGGRECAAHRVAWVLTHGEPPTGNVIRHMCHNRLCVRPDHLAMGTQKDNVADAVQRGTHNHQVILSIRQIEMIAEMLVLEPESLWNAIAVAREFRVKKKYYDRRA